MNNRSVREGAIALDDVLNDIEVPSLDVPDLDASSSSFRDESKDLFAGQPQKVVEMLKNYPNEKLF